MLKMEKKTRNNICIPQCIINISYTQIDMDLHTSTSQKNQITKQGLSVLLTQKSRTPSFYQHDSYPINFTLKYGESSLPTSAGKRPDI